MGIVDTSKTSTPRDGVAPDENAKMDEFREASKDKKHGQDPEAVAERMGTTGDKLKGK